MQVFVSYTRDTRANLEPVLNGLRRLGHTVWFDEELTGGDQWWATVLQRIREADVFIAALSPSYFESTPCFEESQYATALGKPILPVSIQSLRGTIVPQDLTQLQIVDYSTPGDKAAFELMAAVANVRPAPSLPDPLPPTPPTPLSYGPEREMIQRPTLSYDEQLKLVETLAWHVNHQPREDQRQAAVALLKQLRARPDITMRASELLAQALSKEKSGDAVAVAGDGAEPGGTRTGSATETAGAPGSGAVSATAGAAGAGVAAGAGAGTGAAGPAGGAGAGAGGDAGPHGQISWGPVPPRFPQPPPPAVTPAARPSHTGRNVAIGVSSGIAATIALIVVVALLVVHGPAPSSSNQAGNSPTPLPATPTPTVNYTWNVTYQQAVESLTYNGYNVNDPAHYHLLLIQMNFANDSSSPAVLSGEPLDVKDSSGTHYPEDQSSTPGATYTVNPGQSGDFTFAYVVPNGMCKFDVSVVQPSAPSKEYTITSSWTGC